MGENPGIPTVADAIYWWLDMGHGILAHVRTIASAAEKLLEHFTERQRTNPKQHRGKQPDGRIQ